MKGKGGEKSYLIDAALLSKAPTTGSLSYFSSFKLSPGTLVKVPLKRGSVLAVIMRTRSALSARSDIRRAGFLLKKIKKTDILEAVVPREILGALEETAHYYGSAVGPLITNLLPKIFTDEPELFLQKSSINRRKTEEEYRRDTLVFQMETEERFAQYRALVRQAFARGNSVLFIVPTHLDIEKVSRELSRGIEEFVHSWTPGGKKEVVKKTWLKALSELHPILFITTPSGLFLPRDDFDTLILERENSRAYRTLSRPFIHINKFVEVWAKLKDFQLVLGDSVLSLTTLHREKSGEASLTGMSEPSFIHWRLPGTPATLVDAKSTQTSAGRFALFSTELKEMLETAVSEGERVFLFGARKGLAPSTVCGDCGTVLPCHNCGAGVVLHRHGEATIYICHACRSRRESATTCGYCGSWKLVSLGIGTEEIARELKAFFPRQSVLVLDKDHASTDKKAQSVVKEFEENGGFLVGTELAFYHLRKVPYAAVVSMDALFSIPDFGINERIFYIVSRLREITTKSSIVQTRNIGKQVLAWATQGNIIDFYQNEIVEREALLYPPFSIFVKITVPKKDSHKELPKLKERFARYHPDTLKDSMVMRLPRENWPDSALAQELSLLPPHFSIKVDPESIL